MIKVTLRDTVKEFSDGINAYEIAKSFGGGFYKNVCAARINGVNSDLRTVLKDGDSL
ncbi:MAG: TGS domain-containing protein, partial [Clostridia bacterium]|nr:TGS domain-containing protein [Clostridia bacterium]